MHVVFIPGQFPPATVFSPKIFVGHDSNSTTGCTKKCMEVKFQWHQTSFLKNKNGYAPHGAVSCLKTSRHLMQVMSELMNWEPQSVCCSHQYITNQTMHNNELFWGKTTSKLLLQCLIPSTWVPFNGPLLMVHRGKFPLNWDPSGSPNSILSRDASPYPSRRARETGKPNWIRWV